MSSELLVKFPGLKYKDIRILNIETRFKAQIAGGATSWDWGSAGTWSTQIGFQANPSKFYYMDYLNCSCTVNEADFVDAINPNFNPIDQPAGFSFDVFEDLQKASLFLTPFTFSTFRQNVPLNIYYGVSRGASVDNHLEPVLFRVRGSLIQTPALVALGVVDIYIIIQTTIYEISSQKFIADYFGGK